MILSPLVNSKMPKPKDLRFWWHDSLKGHDNLRCDNPGFKVYLFKKWSQKVVDLTESTKNLLKNKNKNGIVLA